MQALTMPRPKIAAPLQWGEAKSARVQMLMTPTAVAALELAMERSGMTRGELIERLVRADAKAQQVVTEALADVQRHQAQQQGDEA